MLSRLLIAALWSTAGKELTWLLFVMFNCAFVTFPCVILGQVWYLVAEIPDICRLSYFTVPSFDRNNLEGLDFRVFNNHLLLSCPQFWFLFMLLCLLFVVIYMFVFLCCCFRC